MVTDLDLDFDVYLFLLCFTVGIYLRVRVVCYNSVVIAVLFVVKCLLRLVCWFNLGWFTWCLINGLFAVVYLGFVWLFGVCLVVLLDYDFSFGFGLMLI